MLLRYGQAVKLLKPIDLTITSDWHNVIAQWKTKYKITTTKQPTRDWAGTVIGEYIQTTIQIPTGTLAVLTYIHVDGSYEYYTVNVPNPVTNRIGGGSKSKLLTADYFTLQLTPDEILSLRNAQGKLLFQRERNNNLAAMKKLEDLQKFDISQL
jgi:hypothetical protein